MSPHGTVSRKRILLFRNLRRTPRGQPPPHANVFFPFRFTDRITSRHTTDYTPLHESAAMAGMIDLTTCPPPALLCSGELRLIFVDFNGCLAKNKLAFPVGI